MRRIKDIEDLREHASSGTVQCFIQLNYGFRSSKDISYNKETEKWNVWNCIDDTEQVLTTEGLRDETNIIRALEIGALYEY